MDIWNRILINLKQRKKLVLLLVVENKGSSPGRQGFKMLVVDDGKRYGSIGGGATEHKLVNRANEMLEKNILTPELHEQVHRTDNEMHSSGMICSGENKVILYPLYDIHIDNIQEIAGHAIIKDEITVKISTSDFRSKSGATISGQYEFKDNIFKEVVGYKHFAYIIGGGHVGLALSKQMKMIDYYVKLFDNRPNLDTFTENKDANEKHIVKYDEIEKYIPEGKNIYIIIASFSHAHDKKILSKLLNKKVAYLGMMGSKNKVKEIYEQLEKEGYDKENFKHVSAPIGVLIKSETPAEIAVSIAAEIIDIRNTMK